MKKLLVLTLLLLLTAGSYVSARTIYDSTGRHIIYDDSIRGHRRAAAEKMEQQRKMQAAAAAKINYEEALKNLEEQNTKTKSHKYTTENDNNK